jgi:KaiC/GvpD/RAD55 family RecA-like ATPase
VKEELEMIASDGFTPGLGIGMPAVDELFTLKRKQFTVVTGLPSSGKSVFVRWYLTEFIQHNDKENIKWALYTPENRPVSREQAKVAEVITGQSFKRGYKNSMTEDLRAKTMRYIQKHFFFISPNKLNFETWLGKVDSDHVNSMESLLQYLIYLKKTEGIFGFVIDAWNKIEHEQPKNQTETTFISKQLDYLINFCDVYDLHCILIAHPTKIEKVGINYRMPCLYDIKGSSAWKEKPDIGVIIHRFLNKKKKAEDIPEDATEDDKIMIDTEAPNIITTEKIRFEEIGKLGKIKMNMDFKKGGRFYLVEDKKKDIPDIAGKLNPKAKEEDDLFGKANDTKDDLPF